MHPLLGIISDEVSQDYDRVIKFAHDFTLDGVELRSVNGKAFKDITFPEVREIAQKNEGAGLKAAGLATPIFKCDLKDRTAIQNHVELFKRAMEFAHLLNANIIRVFTFLRQEAWTSTDDLKRAAEHLALLVEASQDTGLQIGVENESSTLVCTGNEAAEFLEMVEAENVGLIWDPCNILFLPGNNKPEIEDFPQVSNRVIHVHVKNANRDGSVAATYCTDLESGDIDYRLQLKLLKARNYTGWITLETHWRIQALTADQAHLPAGESFSANAEEPSGICMRQLKVLLEDRYQLRV